MYASGHFCHFLGFRKCIRPILSFSFLFFSFFVACSLFNPLQSRKLTPTTPCIKVDIYIHPVTHTGCYDVSSKNKSCIHTQASVRNVILEMYNKSIEKQCVRGGNRRGHKSGEHVQRGGRRQRPQTSPIVRQSQQFRTKVISLSLSVK